MKQFKPATLVTLLFVSFSILAQSPKQISYQAVIRDANNELLQNKALGVQISILKNSIEGDAIYIETHTIVTNDNGLLTLSMGAGAIVSGDFQGLDWASGSHFIKIEVDPNGGTNYTITHSSQLLSVPYALHANTADSLLGGLNEIDGSVTNEIQDLKLNDNELMITSNEAATPIDLSKYLGETMILTAAQRDSIANPKPGTIIWCSDCVEIQYYNGYKWLNLAGGYASAPDTIRPLIEFNTYNTRPMGIIGDYFGLSGQKLRVDTVKFIVQFDELVNDFTAADITYNNGQIINFKSKIYNNPTKNQDMYEVTVVGNQTEGRHYVFIPEKVTADVAGNLNKASDTLAWFYDGTPPVIDKISAIDQNSGNTLAEGSITQSNYIRLTIRFNENLGGDAWNYDNRLNFNTASLKVTNGSISDWLGRGYDPIEAGSNIDYFVDISLDQSKYGEVIIEIADSSFMDQAGNANTESYRFSFKYGPEENFQDDDSDGVENYMDTCPNTPSGVAVNLMGCPDTDSDGIFDNLDTCPDTPTNAEVDASGCSVAQIDTDISGRWKVVFNPYDWNSDYGWSMEQASWNSESQQFNEWYKIEWDKNYKDCFLDDVYVFESNGSFLNDLGSTAFIEQFQVTSDSISIGCDTPISPFDGSSKTHSFMRTGNTKGTITINGIGAYLGTANETNVGYLVDLYYRYGWEALEIPASRVYTYEIEGEYLLVEMAVGDNYKNRFRLQKE